MSKENISTEIEYREMSHLDYLLTLHIKQLREKHGWIQQELSDKMGVAKSFVGNVESCIQRHKYNIRHLPLLALAFGFESVSELFDFPFPEDDKIRLKIIITTTMSDDDKIKSKTARVEKYDTIKTLKK